MRATQQLKYAVYGMFDLAYNGGPGPIRIQEIGGRQRIPARYLEQIFQRLRRAGLVESKRGPGGGYVLGRSPEQITLLDIATAVEGTALEIGEGEAEPAVAERPSFVWDELRTSIERALGRVTIGALCRDAARRGIERADPEPAMYHI